MSSPITPARFNTSLIRSSSPDLPSLGELLRQESRKPPLRSGSNAAPIPAAARSVFTSAAELLREAPEIDIDTEQIIRSPVSKVKTTRKSRAKGTTKHALSRDTAELVSPVEVVLSPKRFKRQMITLDEADDSVQEPLVTKKVPANEGRAKKKATDTVSRHFADLEKSQDVTIDKITEQGHVTPPRARQSALTRRKDWTPPANSITIAHPESDDRELPSSIERAGTSKSVFQSLFDDFALKGEEFEPPPSAQSSEFATEVLRKRKCVDLIPVIDEKQTALPRQRSVSPTKASAAKKKARTLTEIATAPYMPSVPDVDLLAPGTTESLLHYFDDDGHMKALVEHQSAIIDHEKSKPKKTNKSRRTKKGATTQDPILLSPNSALKQSTRQDFVFGTSSQLVLEDSPTLLKEIQAAIQASNQEADPFASSPSDRRTGLWHAGSRDVDGDLLGAKTIDLVGGRPVDQPIQDDTSTINHKPPLDGDFINIEDLCSSSPQQVPDSANPKSHFWQSQKPTSSVTVSVDTSANNPYTRTRNTLDEAQAATPRPKYELFTDAQLTKQVTSYGFKPLKRREAMVALLNQCWTSQHPTPTIAQHSVANVASITTSSYQSPPNKSVLSVAEAIKKPRGRPKTSIPATSADAAISPKRARGRPRKPSVTAKDDQPLLPSTTNATTITKESKFKQTETEIADSDNDDSLSLSARSSPEPVFSSPPAIDLSVSEDGDTSLNFTPTDQEEHLFDHITNAVTSAPCSKDSAHPSWHEKMLLYDPIVVEDLAAWLNTGQLTRVGYDGEVAPSQVKKWCESKSIICLWRVNLHGKERKRF